jgi:hypothetical protein
MDAKIAYMTALIEQQFGVRPTTHRAGRWAMDARYFRLLANHGYLLDCSVTPGMNWENCPGTTNGSKGSNYETYPTVPYITEGILEIPVSVQKNHRIKQDDCHSIKHAVGKRYRAWIGYGKVWLRPNGNNLEDMLAMSEYVYKSKNDYIMFMLHSSEFMPGGSPTFDTEQKIEKLYQDLNVLFDQLDRYYTGCTIRSYGEVLQKKMRKNGYAENFAKSNWTDV